MGERDLTAREEFIGLCLAAAAIVVLFVFIVSRRLQRLDELLRNGYVL
jgi:hypothetical protein